MDAATRDLVRRRAGNCCEYCRLPQAFAPLVEFHIEHIVPRQHGGSDDPDNLALACQHCNSHKGPNLAGLDKETNQVVPLFHPRQQLWREHFAFEDAIIVGTTPVGRVTVYVLDVNSEDRLLVRTELLARDEFGV